MKILAISIIIFAFMNLRRKFKLEIGYCIVFDVFKGQIIFTVCLKQLVKILPLYIDIWIMKLKKNKCFFLQILNSRGS